MDTSHLDVSFVIFNNMSSDNTKEIIEGAGVGYEYIDTGDLEPYTRTSSGDALNRMRLVREYIRDYAIKNKFDYTFFCDCDILVQPSTLKTLLAHNVDFVAATISNSGTVNFNRYACNCMDFKPRKGVYSNPDRWKPHYVCGDGLVEVGGTGAVYLASKELLKKCSYLDTPSLYPEEGEDYSFARECMKKGFKQYIDETHRCLHCFEPDILELYKQQDNKNQAVKIITQRAWLNIPVNEKLSNGSGCSYCKKRGR